MYQYIAKNISTSLQTEQSETGSTVVTLLA